MITWAPATTAELVMWIDDKEVIHPTPKSVFKGRGRIAFDYPSDDIDDFHVFEWTLVFPTKTLHDITVRARWDDGPLHTVGAQRKDIEHSWTSTGVAP